MRVKKISAFVMAVMLVLSPFTLFSFAADGLKDSGSTQVSMMAMRSIAANEGISLAAAEGNSGQYGYNIEPVDLDFYRTETMLGGGGQYNLYRYFIYLPVGHINIKFVFNSSDSLVDSSTYYRGSNVDGPNLGTVRSSVSDNVVSYDFDSLGGFYLFQTRYLSSVDINSVSLVKFSSSILTPVEGISSGYSYSSGVIEASQTTSRVVIDTWDFGNQPAGNYFINIYTYGRNYKALFDLAVGDDIVNGRKLTYTYSNGVYTALVSHGGGDLIIRANFTYAKDTLNSPDTSISSIINGSGTIASNIVSSGSYIFNITDVVAVPLDSAGLEQFGVFGSIVGFLRDEFSSMKSWIATQIDKIAGDDETKATVDSAASELEQEVNDLNTLHGQLDSQASTLEQQFTNDFAVPSEVSGQTANLQLMYSGIFSSLGVFSIFIWLPVVLAVIKKLLRL